MTNYELRMDITPVFKSIYEFAIRNLESAIRLSQTRDRKSDPTRCVNSYPTRERDVKDDPFTARGQSMMRQLLIRLGITLAVGTGLLLDPWTLTHGFLGTLIGSLVSAVLLRAAAQWVEKKDVPYGEAYVTMSLAAIANLLAASSSSASPSSRRGTWSSKWPTRQPPSSWFPLASSSRLLSSVHDFGSPSSGRAWSAS